MEEQASNSSSGPPSRPVPCQTPQRHRPPPRTAVYAAMMVPQQVQNAGVRQRHRSARPVSAAACAQMRRAIGIGFSATCEARTGMSIAGRRREACPPQPACAAAGEGIVVAAESAGR